MIVLDAIALATTAFMLAAGGLGLFVSQTHRARGRHTDRSALARSWRRR